MSNFLCSLASNITSNSMRNLAFHSLLRWKMIILPIPITSPIHFSLGRLGECSFWTWEWKGWSWCHLRECLDSSPLAKFNSWTFSPLSIQGTDRNLVFLGACHTICHIVNEHTWGIPDKLFIYCRIISKEPFKQPEWSPFVIPTSCKYNTRTRDKGHRDKDRSILPTPTWCHSSRWFPHSALRWPSSYRWPVSRHLSRTSSPRPCGPSFQATCCPLYSLWWSLLRPGTWSTPALRHPPCICTLQRTMLPCCVKTGSSATRRWPSPGWSTLDLVGRKDKS